MARITLTAGELTIDVRDRLPWLSRRRVAAVESLLEHFKDESDGEQELATITELQADDEDDLDDDEDEGLPEIGFRSRPH